MHNTHIDAQGVLCASFENCQPRIENGEIDFDSIMAQKEYFVSEVRLESRENMKDVFMGEEDESTEIDSIVNSLVKDESTAMSSPLKVERMRLEETAGEGTDEILAILKQPKTTKNVNYVRGLSRSNPNFYSSKKVSMSGRVLQGVASDKISRPVPERVSNPFSRNCAFVDVSKIDSLLRNCNNFDNSVTKPSIDQN